MSKVKGVKTGNRQQAAGIKKNIAGFLETAKNRILVFDGGFGSLIMKADLSEDDYGGYAGCNEYLSISKPDLIASLHADYFSAGADVVETNTFGACRHVLEEHGLAGRTEEINKTAARIAKKEAEKFSTKIRPRFVAGSIGPGSKLPSLRHITFDELKSSYIPQVKGLLAGGADCFIVETSQDLLQIKAAVCAIAEVLDHRGEWRPIIAQVTVDVNGKTLTGSDIPVFLAAIEPLPVAAIGINCSLGPDGMAAAARYLSENSGKLLSIMPNAGLPEIKQGKTVYSLSPENFAEQMLTLAKDIGMNIVGGCCGTTPGHIKLLANAVKAVSPRKPVKNRKPALASLYQAQDICIFPKPLIIGERANASGSKRFGQLLRKADFSAMADSAVSHEAEGAHALDLSVALAGRDEKKDINELTALLNTRTQLPIMLDSTDPAVIETGLKNIAGRPVVNSANLEEQAVKKAKRIIDICRRYGAALVVLAIDEKGMAMTKERKIEAIKKLVAMAKAGGLAEQDIFIDVLTFTLASGDPALKDAGRQTLAAIKEVKKLWPKSFAVLGISNISYGLPFEARKALNSVFLKRAVEHGLDAAIFHSGKISQLHLIPPKILKLCDDLIFNRPVKGKSPLESFTEYFFSHKPVKEIKKKNVSAEERLKFCVIAGISDGIENILKSNLEKMSAMDVINKTLLPAMSEVGKLFRQGKKPLPFVLRSAEVMRLAMKILQPFLGEVKAKNKGKFVIATVRGDIHDIGKNLVDVIFSANGFEVINLGVKQSAESVASAAKQHRPNAIGLSGLLVESAKAMREYLPVFDSAGVSVPVLCGGAALNANYVQQEMSPLYRGQVHYAKDVLDGLKIMEEIIGKPHAARSLSEKLFSENIAGQPQIREKLRPAKPRAGQKVLDTNVSVIKKVPKRELFKLIDREALFARRWQFVLQNAEKVYFHKYAASGWRYFLQTEERAPLQPSFRAASRGRSPHAARSLPEKLFSGNIASRTQIREKLSETQFADMLKKLWDQTTKKKLWQPKAAYCFFKANIKKGRVLLYELGSDKKLLELNFSARIGGNFLKRLSGWQTVALQLVTVGPKVKAETMRLGKRKMIEKQFLLHGLAAEVCEALAKWCNANIERELHWKQSRRLSPGYPIWPRLKEQKKIFALLHPERIGVKLTETFQMVPEYSTSAIVFRIS